jgi:hypothetical protein
MKYIITLFIIFMPACMSWTPYEYVDPIEPDESIRLVVEDCFVGSSMDECADYTEEPICTMDLCT